MPNPVQNLAYDITTLIGQVRFHAADTDITPDPNAGRNNEPVTQVVDNATFSDGEVNYALSISQQNPQYAAAWLLESLAADQARLGTVIRIQSLSVDRKELSATIAARAAQLRKLAMIPPAVQSPDQQFSTDNTAQSIVGSMDIW